MSDGTHSSGYSYYKETLVTIKNQDLLVFSLSCSLLTVTLLILTAVFLGLLEGFRQPNSYSMSFWVEWAF